MFKVATEKQQQHHESVAGRLPETKPLETVEAPHLHSFRIAPYLFLSDFYISRDQALFKELASLRDQVYKELKLPSTNRHVHVYLFKTRETYERYMKAHYPELPPRRAFFVAQPRAMGKEEDLLVFTSWSDRIQQDLRHELTHALLHSVLKDVPLWLDEGLAEYFELPPDQDGVNMAHLKQLDRSVVFEPSMMRLEKLGEVRDMSPTEYREAWAWVHLMLRGNEKGKKVLLSYLQELRRNPKPGPLQPRLAKVIPEMNGELTQHIRALRAQARASGGHISGYRPATSGFAEDHYSQMAPVRTTNRDPLRPWQ